MSDQAFERAVADKLRAHRGIFVYHPPDDPRTRQWKPGDFIYGHRLSWGIIECKEINGVTFPLSRWSAQQRGHAEASTNAGGRYWLVVRFQPEGRVIAFPITSYIATRAHGSLHPKEGITLNLIQDADVSKSFSLAPLFP